jgi:OOP family OmpA-OmpF porin
MAIRKSVALLLGSATSLALACSATAASAQAVPSVELRGFNPSVDPQSGLYLEPASSPDTLELNVGLWMHYGFQPVTLRDPVADEVAVRVVENQLTADLVANVGLFQRLAVGIDLPFALYQGGDEPTDDARRVLGAYALPGQALGDLKLLAKVTLVQPTNAEFGGFALALHERFGLPTGDEASFIGEGHVTSETRLLGEYRYVALSIHGALGVKLRGEQAPFGCASVPPGPDGEAGYCPTTFGHEIPWGLGLAFEPKALGIDQEGHWLWFLESYGYLPMVPEPPFTSAKLSQAQLATGARFRFSDFSVLAAVDMALLGGIGTPPVGATLSFGWAPRVYDKDQDAVPDDKDQCPELKEDPDNYQDDDGCPDWDNDNDGVPDEEDRCPLEKEDEDGFQDEDGCPDRDNDGDSIADTKDACPDEPGPAHADPKQSGCPDTDGDRVADFVDACPTEPGRQFADPKQNGCPDRDGDAIADLFDACPDVAGKPNQNPRLNGCPDTDNDGIPDPKDACPDLAGPPNPSPQLNGCPDKDGDGIPDKVDGCPDKKGKPRKTARWNGCP